jgi:type I restriction enzyme S subunit
MTASNQVAEASGQYLAEAARQTVPVGYKQTEVGVIPNDWDVSPMSKVTNLMTNGFVGIAKTHYTDSHEGIIYIQGYNVEENGFNFNGIKRVTPEFHKKNIKSCLRSGDILMVQTGDVGLVTIVPPELEGSNCHALIINRFKPNYDPKYFAYLLNSSLVRLRLKELETGTTMKHINVGDLLHFEVPFPKDKQEQTAIANALSDVDALINELEKLIAKKQAIKTATLQQLLTGRTRLPPFALREDGTQKGYKPSELGEIPEDWEVASLGDIGQCVIGLTYSPNDVADFGTLVLRSSNVQGNRLAYEDNVYVQMDLPERVIVKKGDILVCVRNGSRQLIGKCALIDAKAEGSAFGAFMSVFRTQSYSFVFYQFQSDIIQNQINEIMGATINQITNKDMGGFKIPLPKLEEEQTTIATILSDMDAEIQTLQQRLSKTRQIKQGMMQELLTGRIRLIKGGLPVTQRTSL